MAAEKTLWVKLRYRIRPSPASTTGLGLAWDQIDQETNHDIKSSVMPLAFDQPSTICYDPHPMMTPPLEPTHMSSSIEHGPYGHSLPIPPPHMVPLTTSQILSQRKRRKSTSALKRSSSTPNVRAQQHGDSASLAEKRRNKLGYHRTSIACSESKLCHFPGLYD